jgi:NADPH-dependent curcumin reductase CurA
MQYLTAWGALIEQAKLTAGDFVVVTAASSSVGIGAFQVAKLWARQLSQPLGPEPRGKRSLTTEQIMLS